MLAGRRMKEEEEEEEEDVKEDENEDEDEEGQRGRGGDCYKEVSRDVEICGCAPVQSVCVYDVACFAVPNEGKT